MVIAALEGSLERARALQDQLMPLHHALFQEANPIPLKWALHTLKKIPPGIRLPLTTLSVECQSAVRQALQVAECI